MQFLSLSCAQIAGGLMGRDMFAGFRNSVICDILVEAGILIVASDTLINDIVCSLLSWSLMKEIGTKVLITELNKVFVICNMGESSMFPNILG